MADGRSALEWSQTAEILCVLYNVHRDTSKRSKPYTSAEFNPYADKTKPQRRKMSPEEKRARLDMLKDALNQRKGK